MVRLGENVFISGKLDPKASRRTLQALSTFKKRAEELKTEKIIAFATSALRDASDAEDLIVKIRKTLRMDVHIISGREEATLIADAILNREKPPKGFFGLVDIGGGSTEVSVCRGNKLVVSESFPLGVARLQQIFLRTIPPEDGKEAVKHLRGHVRTLLKTAIKNNDWPKTKSVIASSGTARALDRMCNRNTGKDITPKWLEKLIRTMTPLTIKQIQSLPGMDPRRADLMLAGTVVLAETLRALGAESATSTEYSLRDGILDQQLRMIKPAPKNDRWDLEPFLEKSVRFGEEPARLRWLVGASLRLFRKLRPLHKLDDKWFAYLALAVMFRNSGRSVSPSGYEAHSAYIVQHAELPLAEAWETDFVAELCFWHTNGKSGTGKLPFQSGENKSKGAAFVKLLALLRLIDCFDYAKPKRVEPERVEIRSKTVRFWLSRGDSTELALLKIQQKKALFEKVFRRNLITLTR